MVKKLIRLAGPALFLLILSRMDIAQVATTLRALRAQPLLPALILYPCLILLKAWRWQSLLRQQGIRYGLADAFLAYNSSLAVGYVTPGRVGEFTKALYLQRDEGIPFGQSLSGVFMDRLFDLYALLMTAILGVMAFSLPRQVPAVALGVSIIVGLAPLLILIPELNRRAADLLVRGAQLIGIPRYQEDITRTLSHFQKGLDQLLTVRLLLPLLVTIAAYALFYLQCYLSALALQLPLSYPRAAFAVSVASLLALLPVSISGVGVRDLVFITLLHPLGITAETAVGYSLLILFVFNVFGGALGAAAWVVKPLR
jgi:uncharacterized protein (TIRG00374 family)